MRKFEIALGVFLFAIGLTAVLGAKALLNNEFILPPNLLQDSPFTTYFWPAIILAVVIGGTHIVAGYMLWIKSRFSREAAAIAGFGMIIWLFTELYVLTEHHWLQIAYFVPALITLISVMLLLKYQNRQTI